MRSHLLCAAAVGQGFEQTAGRGGVWLHHIQLMYLPDLTFWEFSHADELIEPGGQQTERHFLEEEDRRRRLDTKRLHSLSGQLSVGPLRQG